jgi:hypothetical protein
MAKYSRPLRIFLEEFELAVHEHEARMIVLIRETALDPGLLDELVASGNALDEAYDRLLFHVTDQGYAVGTVHPSGVLTDG